MTAAGTTQSIFRVLSLMIVNTHMSCFNYASCFLKVVYFSIHSDVFWAVVAGNMGWQSKWTFCFAKLQGLTIFQTCMRDGLLGFETYLEPLQLILPR